MKSNLLHINLDKCYYMHFCPNAVKTKKDHLITDEHESSSLLDLDNTLNISGTSIPEVNNIKFLGVTNDNQLLWIPHIDNLNKKLKSATKKHTLISSKHLVAQDQLKLKFWAQHII